MHLITVTIILLWKLIIYLSIPTITLANNDDFLNENEIKKNIIQITQENISNTEKEQAVEKLKLALYAISEIKHSKIKIQEYQDIINNFPTIIHQLYEKNNEKNSQNHYEKNDHNITTSNELRKYQIKINQQLAILDQELQHEQNIAQSINNSLISLPQQHTETKKELNEINRKISSINTIKKISHLEKYELIALQALKKSKQHKISEFELAQLSANHRQEISRLHIESLKNQYDQLDKKSQILHIQLHNIRERETTQTIENIELLSNITKNNIILPNVIIQQIQTNRNLSQSLKKQIKNIDLVTLQQRKITSHTLQTRQTFSKLLEQTQWIKKSTALGETLRTQLSKLPKLNFEIEPLDIKMAKLRNKRLQYEEQINNLPTSSLQNNKEYQILTTNQKNILNTQINIQRKLLNSLLTNYDIQILELTKLKITHEQLHDLMKDINKTIHQYLFWIADTQPITLSYPYKIYQDLYQLLIFNKNILYQFKEIIKTILCKNVKISILFLVYCLLIGSTYTKYHQYYYSFLQQFKKQLKINQQKYFLLTLKNIFWSSVIATPIPILWLMLGYILSQTWEYPTSYIIGKGIILSSLILWVLTITLYFSSKNGLFILYFKWNEKKIRKITQYYNSHLVIIFTFIIVIIFNDYNNKEFYSTLGRLFFIILCACLTHIAYVFKKTNLSLYLDKNGSSNNFINHFLWNFIIIFPIITATISYFGYLSLAQTLLIHLEISLIICLTSSIIYYTIRCWIITQEYKILHKYQKNNNKTSIKNSDKNKEFSLPLANDTHHDAHNITKNSINKKNIKTIKNATTLNIMSQQSLQFIKFIIILTTFTIIIYLWSELHFIFKFLKKITLWDITSSIQGKNNIQPITLSTLLTTTLICSITIKFTKNLPYLLKITILEHINLTPGTNYAIITLTKYTIMILGVIIGCSYIGFEWSKLQWLIAAIGVGLGFGLQEIFGNFICGLIVLFEKPIRIGDTITICNLTGNITRINTRATSIIDRDHKEIIIPNKEFITKKFINWSLSDTITRVILKVPAPSEVNITKIINILLEATTHCPLVLQIPKPEVYLIDIQQGIPLFEIRMHTSKISYRMPLRHQVHILILKFYKKHGLQLPFPNIRIHKN